MKRFLGAAALVLSVAVIAIPLTQGRYLEAVALGGVMSVLAWFMLQTSQLMGRKHNSPDEDERE